MASWISASVRQWGTPLPPHRWTGFGPGSPRLGGRRRGGSGGRGLRLLQIMTIRGCMAVSTPHLVPSAGFCEVGYAHGMSRSAFAEQLLHVPPVLLGGPGPCRVGVLRDAQRTTGRGGVWSVKQCEAASRARAWRSAGVLPGSARNRAASPAGCRPGTTDWEALTGLPFKRTCSGAAGCGGRGAGLVGAVGPATHASTRSELGVVAEVFMPFRRLAPTRCQPLDRSIRPSAVGSDFSFHRLFVTAGSATAVKLDRRRGNRTNTTYEKGVIPMASRLDQNVDYLLRRGRCRRRHPDSAQNSAQNNQAGQEEAPLLIGHRGAAGTPENTVAAFKDGRRLRGYLRNRRPLQRADGVPFLFHDDIPARTTDVEKVFPDRAGDPVTSFTWDRELQQLDAGSSVPSLPANASRIWTTPRRSPR